MRDHNRLAKSRPQDGQGGWGMWAVFRHRANSFPCVSGGEFCTCDECMNNHHMSIKTLALSIVFVNMSGQYRDQGPHALSPTLDTHATGQDRVTHMR